MSTFDTGAMQELTQSTLYGFFWMFLGKGAQAALQLLVLIILARLLIPADFGVVAAALVLVGFASLFSQLGVGPAVVQRPNLETRHLRTAFTLSLIFGATLTGLSWLFAPSISSFFRITELLPVVQAMSPMFLLQSPSIVAESLLQRELGFRWLAGIEVIAFAGGFGAVAITLAFLGLGVWALVGAHLAQAFLKTAILLVVQPHPKRPLLEKRALSELMVFGGGFTLARIGNYLAGQGDNLVVGRWLGAEALGFYGRAHQLMTVPATLFGDVLDRVLFPAMAKVQHHPERLATAFRRGIALIGIVMLPASVALFFLAPELIYVVLGPGWDKAIVPFQIFTVGMLFRTSYKMSDSLSRATGAVYRRAWRQGVFAGLVIGGTYIGQHWGLPGVAAGVLCAYAINFILMAALSLHLAKMRWQSFWAAHLPALLLGIVLGVEVSTLAPLLREWQYPPFVVLLTSATCAFVSACLLMRYLPKLFLGQDGLWMLQTLSAHFIPPSRGLIHE
jgi:O-antigen/teichoic acid export membrane protein